MTTEHEFLGNSPTPSPAGTTWSRALQDAAALFETARRASDNGDDREALAAGAEAVGMAAVAVDLKRRQDVEPDFEYEGIQATTDQAPPLVRQAMVGVPHPVVRFDPLRLSSEEFMAAMAAEEEADQTRDLMDGGAQPTARLSRTLGEAFGLNGGAR